MAKRRLSGPNTGLNGHIMVVQLACEMAEGLFEVYARDNAVYRKLRADGQVTEKASRKVFVERVAPKMLEEARAALASMLGAEDTSQFVKDQIYEALVLDSDLRANRQVTADKAVVPSYLH